MVKKKILKAHNLKELNEQLCVYEDIGWKKASEVKTYFQDRLPYQVLIKKED